MKKLIGLVVILTVLVLGSYYGMGVITERTLRKNLEIVNQSNGLLVNIVDYKRGWCTSEARLNWRFQAPEHVIKDSNGKTQTIAAKTYNMQMPLKIHHGPIIFADSNVLFGLGYASTTLELPNEYMAQFNQVYTDNSIKPNLNLSIFVNYLNTSDLRVNVPKFKLISKQGNDQFEWLGMSSDVRVSSKLNQVAGDIAVKGLRFMKEDVKVDIGPVSGGYNLHRTDSGLYLGDASVSFPSAVVMEADQKVLDVEQFSLRSNSDVKKGLFSSSLTASLNKLSTHGKTYGASSVSMAFRNLDAQTLAEINDQVAKMQTASDSERQRLGLGLLPDVLKLVNKGAEFELSNLNVATPDGKIAANLLISLPNEQASNPFQLLQKITGKGKLDISAVVLKDFMKESIKQKMLSAQALKQAMAVQQTADTTTTPPAATTAVVVTTPTSITGNIDQQASQQADEKIASMVKTGVLIVDGTQYICELKLNQGQLDVNGKPFNPAMIQF